MFLKFFKRKNVLLFIICLSMLWILTFLYVVNKNEDIKSFNGGLLASSNKNFSNDDFKQLEKLEILVQKVSTFYLTFYNTCFVFYADENGIRRKPLSYKRFEKTC